jgi:murein hydrolase activator
MASFLKSSLLSFAIAMLVTSAIEAEALETESASSDREQHRVATEKKLAQLQAQIKRIQTRQQQQRSKLTNEQQALKTTDIEIGKTRRSLEQTRAQLQTNQQQLEALLNEQKHLNQQKKAQQQNLAKLIKSAYLSGQQEFIKLLLNQEDPSKLGRMLVYYRYLNDSRAEKIQRFTNTLEKLLVVAEQIKLKREQLLGIENELDDKNRQLMSLKSAREQAITELNKSLSSNRAQLQELKANEQDLLSLIEALKQTVAELIPEESLTGLASLRQKLSMPARGPIFEAFGTARGNEQLLWSGILIGANEGAPVNAVHHGRIVFADYLRGFGLMTIIDHGEGYMSLYGHNESLFKQPGDWVEAGERIATVGQTGGYSKPGLYFEIRHKSKALDPLRYIRR